MKLSISMIVNNDTSCLDGLSNESNLSIKNEVKQ